jgi:methionine-rich copper-binding protein CopC
MKMILGGVNTRITGSNPTWGNDVCEHCLWFSGRVRALRWGVTITKSDLFNIEYRRMKLREEAEEKERVTLREKMKQSEEILL